jgi:hypothetical protein
MEAVDDALLVACRHDLRFSFHGVLVNKALNAIISIPPAIFKSLHASME